MHPEIFEVPFLHVTVKSYGTMMVIGFLLAAMLMRRMMKKAGQNPEWVTNAALYALITGIVGARVFFILHHWEGFQDNLLSVFAVWKGGLEFLGGVLTAIGFLLVYLRVQKLPWRLYFDAFAVGLMLGLAFGRMGCLLNGCCYGRPAEVPWAMRFPYDSFAYQSQAYPDAARDRQQARLSLPTEYFGWLDPKGQWIQASEQEKYTAALKPFDLLTDAQKKAVTEGPYRCLPVHPTQIYSSLGAFLLTGVFYLLWCKVGLRRPGVVLGLVMMAYGMTRFVLETLRDDNPFEYAWWMLYRGGTISQNICIYLIILGAILLALVSLMPVKEIKAKNSHTFSKK